MVPKVPCDSTASLRVRSANEVQSDCSEVIAGRVGGTGAVGAVDVSPARGDLCSMRPTESESIAEGNSEDSVPTATLLRAALDVALANAPGPLVLAVSGGRDSMALLFAMARWAPDRLAAVATYDHGTGRYATAAAGLVAAEARKLGLTVVRERARTLGESEAEWRSGRWSFLHRVAKAFRARVATAHTRDDQVETVVMRLLRGAGARGLAALAATSPVVRPWLGVSRDEVAAWVQAETLPYMDDPTNATVRFLRGRLRHDLLPVIESASPGFADAMLSVGERAARWRQELDLFVDGLGPTAPRAGVLRIPCRALEETTPAGRAVLWSALFARVGVALDARGTASLVRFTNGGRRGAYVSLAGGAVALRTSERGHDAFELRRAPSALPSARHAQVNDLPTLPTRWDRWRFRRLATEPSERATVRTSPDGIERLWNCLVAMDGSITVRAWQAGDRIRSAAHPAGRRVTRYFVEAGVPALDRIGWPVVLQEQEIVWVPGVCRGDAAPNRPGRSELIWYRCEREYD